MTQLIQMIQLNWMTQTTQLAQMTQMIQKIQPAKLTQPDHQPMPAFYYQSIHYLPNYLAVMLSLNLPMSFH